MQIVQPLCCLVSFLDTLAREKGEMRHYHQGFFFTFGRVRKRAFLLRIYFWENLSRKLKLVTRKTEEKPSGIINSNPMSHLYNIYGRGWTNLLLVDFCNFTDVSTYCLSCFVFFVYPLCPGIAFSVLITSDVAYNILLPSSRALRALPQ